MSWTDSQLISFAEEVIGIILEEDLGRMVILGKILEHAEGAFDEADLAYFRGLMG